MRLKTFVRERLDELVGRYGYKLTRKYTLEPRTMDYKLLREDEYHPFVKADYEAHIKENKPITLNWIIPLLGRGSGGHMTIFRTIRFLSEQGIHNRIYMCWDDSTEYPPEELRAMVKDFYGYDLGDNEIAWDHRTMPYADGIVATSWQSAYVARRFDNCLEKFYFVQDYEPWFYPRGSVYFLSENTYKFGYKGITAGLFLAEKLKNDFGMDTVGFRFSYDRQIYRAHAKTDDVKRIFFYARPYTARREFEIGVFALELLAKRMPDIEVVMAGQSVSDYEFPFSVTDKGVMAPADMSRLYGDCDICLVLSATNLSLVPLEVMASGSVVVSDRGAYNEWELNDENAVLCDPDPWDIASKMEEILKDEKRRHSLIESGKKYADGITWDSEMERVGDFIKRCVDEKKKAL